MPPQNTGAAGHPGAAGHRAAGDDGDEVSSNASSDYHEPQGFREHLEDRQRRVKNWIRKNRILFDFLAYSVFLITFTVVAMEANPGVNLIEQVRAAFCCCYYYYCSFTASAAAAAAAVAAAASAASRGGSGSDFSRSHPGLCCRIGPSEQR